MSFTNRPSASTDHPLDRPAAPAPGASPTSLTTEPAPTHGLARIGDGAPKPGLRGSDPEPAAVALTTFQICVDAEAGALARVLEPFAVRGLLPVTLSSSHDPARDCLDVTVRVAALEAAQAEWLMVRVGTIFAVRDARVLPDARAAAAA